MSAPSAIAAVTRTLAGLLETALQVEDPSYRVTTLPLDKSNAETQLANRLNLFLLQPSHNAALRNANAAYVTAPGESARPPLAINLTYIITTYGEATPETKDQRILGLAMQFFNDHPVLLPGDISNAFPGSGLETQFERVRITPRDLSLEDMSRMWSTFMTQYRTSTAYDVSVVLIDSAGAASGPPVLRRGEQDAGVFVGAGLPPLLTAVLPPELLRRGNQVVRQPGVLLGQTLTLEGERLPSDGAVLVVQTPGWGRRQATIDTLVPGPRFGTLQVTLPDPPPEIDPPAGPALAWAPGIYTASLVVRRPGAPDIVSTAPEAVSVPFAIAPDVQIGPGNTPPGDVAVTIACSPPPREGQVILLLIADRPPLDPSAVVPPAGPGQPAQVQFLVEAMTAGEYLVRLRVDGSDSLPYTVVTPPGGGARLEFDPTHKIVVA